jgi:hypothetical protein
MNKIENPAKKLIFAPASLRQSQTSFIATTLKKILETL